MKSSERTRRIRVGRIEIGGGAPIAVQSMIAVRTTDITSALVSIRYLSDIGAEIVRLVVDTDADAKALAEIRPQTTANLSVDLQENYRLAAQVAPYVDALRYNPGHLHHHEREVPWQEKVTWLANVAREHGCALRVGVNCGSLDPTCTGEKDPMLRSALEHVDLLESIGFTQYCVSLKSSDPDKVLEVNRAFAALRPFVPLHLGVTEAGAPPLGIVKTRLALEPLLAEGIGDTLRVSLTLENVRKNEEVLAGKSILRHVEKGDIIQRTPGLLPKLNVISCPSCARCQSSRFVQLAREIENATRFAICWPATIAVMGCRVNGPGETDHADIGVWCGSDQVHLKDGPVEVGVYSYSEVIPHLVKLLQAKIPPEWRPTTVLPRS